MGSFRPIYDAKATEYNLWIIWPNLPKAFLHQPSEQLEIIGMVAITLFHIRHTPTHTVPPASVSMWEKLEESFAILLTQLKIIVMLSLCLQIHYDNSSGIEHYSLFQSFSHIDPYFRLNCSWPLQMMAFIFCIFFSTFFFGCFCFNIIIIVIIKSRYKSWLLMPSPCIPFFIVSSVLCAHKNVHIIVECKWAITLFSTKDKWKKKKRKTVSKMKNKEN